MEIQAQIECKLQRKSTEKKEKKTLKREKIHHHWKINEFTFCFVKKRKNKNAKGMNKILFSMEKVMENHLM